MQGKDIDIRSFGIGVLCFIAVVSPSLALFSGQALAPAFILAALCPLILFIKNRDFTPLYQPLISKIVLVFFAYSILSVLWAIDPVESMDLLYRMGLLFVGSVALFDFVKQLKSRQKCFIGQALLVGIVLCIILANIEIMADGVLTKFFRGFQEKEHIYELVDLNRGAAYLSIIIWPVLAALLNRNMRLLAGGVLLATLVTLMRLESQSSFIAIIVGMLVFGFVYLLGRKAINLIIVGTVASVIAVAVTAKLMDPAKMFSVIPQIPNSASEIRLYIWDYTADRAWEKPLLGWGFNASRSIPVDESEYVLGGRHPLPLHPHNNVLQVWLELGVVGIVIFTAFLLSIMQYIKGFKGEESHCLTHPVLESNMKRDMASIIKTFTNGCHVNLSLALLMGFIVTYFALGETGFGIWQNWWVAGGLIAAGLLLGVIKR